MSVKIICVGPLNGRLEDGLSRLSRIHSQHGPFDICFIIGDLFDPDTPSNEFKKSIASLESKGIEIPLPVYFVLGRSPLPKGLVCESNKEVCENLFYLGRSGVFKMHNGLNVAFLGGTCIENATCEACSYRSDDIEKLMQIDAQKSPIDLFITLEWPKGIENLSQNFLSISSHTEGSIKSSQKVISEILMHITPKYHITSGERFFEREPYACGPNNCLTRFVALQEFKKDSKISCFYAFNIVPQSSENKVGSVPYTKCPFTENLERGSINDVFFRGPVPGYICRICNTAGHFMNMCSRNTRKRRNIDEWDAHSKNSAQTFQRDMNPGSCWFCTCNPKFEKHLVFYTGENLYLSLSKGGLTRNHFLIVLSKHYPSLESLKEESSEEYERVLAEISDVKARLHKLFTSENKMMVAFETFLGRTTTDIPQHYHIQIMGLDSWPGKVLTDTFKRLAESNQMYTIAGDVHRSYMDIGYTYLEIYHKIHDEKPYTPEKFTFVSKYGANLSKLLSNFGRFAISRSIGIPERANWRKCVMSLEQEKRLCASVEANFKRTIK